MFCSCRPIKLASIQRAVNKCGGKAKTGRGRGGPIRLTRSSGINNPEPLDSKPEIIEEDMDRSEHDPKNELKEEKDNNKGHKQTA